MKTIFFILLRLALLLLPYFLRAQEAPDIIAREYIRAHSDDWGLSLQDLNGMTVNDMYADPSSGITRVWFLQRYEGIPVYNAILNLNIAKEGKVFFAGNRFVPDLAGKVNTTAPVLSPSEAVSKLAAQLGLPAEALRLKEKTGDAQFVFEKGGIAKEDVPVQLSFQPHEGKVLLAWDILLAPAGSFDKWSARVDAVTGTVLSKLNWTVYCRVGGSAFSRESVDFREQSGFTDGHFGPDVAAAQYNVWPPPLESPAHGPRTLMTNPADPIASPFGWHDWNGQPGAESTKTIGNNAYSYQDRKNIGNTSSDEPNGGANLYFDFPFNAVWEPKQYTNAAVVNLFYWANYMHDFSYRFGFDEPAGNFQFNTYGKGGVGADQMNCLAQTGADVGLSDYPHYTHSNDGATGAIRLMEATPAYKYLTVNAPAGLAGQYEVGIPAPGWGAGAYLTNTPVTAEVVLADDGIEEPFAADGCETIVNAPELAGKIALFERGGCDMSYKAWQAQNAGAMGVIVCNQYDEYAPQISSGKQAAAVNIPVVLISATTGEAIRPYIGNGLNVSLVKSATSPKIYDMCLDNGIIAHEYGHGITWRLMGGPSAVCIENYESPDEGWSDFFALATTVRPGDTGTTKRGWGIYILGEPAAGLGSRRYPYSTDMNISPLTYDDLASSPDRHDIGEIWANMLWDMYWAFSDRYGWSADPYLESSGNYKAIRLVFDGLKNLPCYPGFVDARNAILAADSALYNGENACLLWNVFARRGLGYSAEQGSSFDIDDQKAAFDVPPQCANRLLIEKTVTDFIQPGGEIQVAVKVGNYKPETATNVVVTDEIPAGTVFKPNSSNWPAHVQGNTVSFQLDDMSFAQKAVITYTLSTAPNAWSQRKFLDEVPDKNGANWLSSGIVSPYNWTITDAYPAHSGDFAWYVKEVPEVSNQILALNPDRYTFHVQGARPALRFYHRYQTEGGLNGGIVEVKATGASSWKQVSSSILRNGYTRPVHYQTFSGPDVRAFSGDSGPSFEATYVDLSEWMGEDIQIRFHFSCVTDTIGGIGWLIDDVEFMDLLAYNGEACVSSGQGDHVCTLAAEAGTIVDSREAPLDAGEQTKELAAKIFPNPATDVLTVELSGEHQQDVNVALLTTDGRQLLAQSFGLSGNDRLNLDIALVPAGLYFVKVSSEKGRFVGKVVIQK